MHRLNKYAQDGVGGTGGVLRYGVFTPEEDNNKTTTRQMLNLCIPMMPFWCERHRNAQVQHLSCRCLVVVLLWCENTIRNGSLAWAIGMATPYRQLDLGGQWSAWRTDSGVTIILMWLAVSMWHALYLWDSPYISDLHLFDVTHLICELPTVTHLRPKKWCVSGSIQIKFEDRTVGR